MLTADGQGKAFTIQPYTNNCTRKWSAWVYYEDRILKSFWVDWFSFFFSVPDLSKMKLSLGHISDAGVAELWLCSSPEQAPKPQAGGLGPGVGCWNQSKKGLCLHWGGQTSHRPAMETVVQARGSFCPMKGHPSYQSTLCRSSSWTKVTDTCVSR